MELMVTFFDVPCIFHPKFIPGGHDVTSNVLENFEICYCNVFYYMSAEIFEIWMKFEQTKATCSMWLIKIIFNS